MKIIYEFDTDNENFCQDELKRLEHKEDMASCLYDIQNQLRQWYKYDNRNSIPVEEIQDKILDIYKDNDVNMDILWR